jgi:hypothetical protein
VQFIEVSVTGVRSAVITLSAPDMPQRITLFPMLHLGSPAFYTAVTARLGRCSVVLAEGIQGRSLIAQVLTAAYRLAGRHRKLDLVLQHIDFRQLTAEIINPDMTSRQLRAGMRAVPMVQRLLLALIAPLVGAAFLLLGTRRMIARYAATDDLPEPNEVLIWDKAPELNELLVGQRDALLAAALDRVLDQHQDEAIEIAVVYGAGHMPGLIRYLTAKHQYRPREAEWLTVFDF